MLARMMLRPTSRRSSGSSALTVALVPTGMKMGVSTTPWGVSRRPPGRASRRPAGGGTDLEAGRRRARAAQASARPRAAASRGLLALGAALDVAPSHRPGSSRSARRGGTS